MVAIQKNGRQRGSRAKEGRVLGEDSHVYEGVKRLNWNIFDPGT